MRQFRKFTAIGILFTAITGTLSHFLYEWSGNNEIIGLLTPVSESIWEHMKLLFFPALLYAMIMIAMFGKKYPGIIPSLCLGILTGTLLIPVFYYVYTSLLGRDIFILDIAVFLVSILIAFRISRRLASTCALRPYTPVLIGLICLLFACFILFTFHPPAGRLFEDPRGGESSAFSAVTHMFQGRPAVQLPVEIWPSGNFST